MLKTRASWVALTVVLCVVWALVAWFGFYSPRLDEASSLKDDTNLAKTANDIQQIKVAKLSQQFDHIDDYRDAVAAIRTKLPAELELSDALDEIDAAAQSAGVVIATSKVDPGKDVDVVASSSSATGSVKVPQAPASSEQSSGSSSAATKKAAPKPVVVAIPITLTTYGSYANTTRFLDALQTKTARYVLVSSVQATAQAAADASGAAPETEDGDLLTVVQAFVFSYPEATSSGSDSSTGQGQDATTGGVSDKETSDDAAEGADAAPLPRLKGDQSVFGVTPEKVKGATTEK